jgi:hypothetical protein
LARCLIAVRTATAGEQELAGPFAGGRWIVIDHLAGLLAQFKSDRPPGFLLADSCAIRRVFAGGDIPDPDGNDVSGKCPVAIRPRADIEARDSLDLGQGQSGLVR